MGEGSSVAFHEKVGQSMWEVAWGQAWRTGREAGKDWTLRKAPLVAQQSVSCLCLPGTRTLRHTKDSLNACRLAAAKKYGLQEAGFHLFSWSLVQKATV